MIAMNDISICTSTFKLNKMADEKKSTMNNRLNDQPTIFGPVCVSHYHSFIGNCVRLLFSHHHFSMVFCSVFRIPMPLKSAWHRVLFCLILFCRFARVIQTKCLGFLSILDCFPNVSSLSLSLSRPFTLEQPINFLLHRYFSPERSTNEFVNEHTSHTFSSI